MSNLNLNRYFAVQGSSAHATVIALLIPCTRDFINCNKFPRSTPPREYYSALAIRSRKGQPRAPSFPRLDSDDTGILLAFFICQ